MTTTDFTVALRGYDIRTVDALIARIEEALRRGDPALRASARAAITQAALRPRLRGYDRHQVDEYLGKAMAALTDV